MSNKKMKERNRTHTRQFAQVKNLRIEEIMEPFSPLNGTNCIKKIYVDARIPKRELYLDAPHQSHYA